MDDTKIDRALIGIWLLPGHLQTYEITEDGGYFIAEPDEDLTFLNEGEVMIWGGRQYSRILGDGCTPVGTWREEDTGDGWDFTDDHGYSILSADPTKGGETFIGIWALRDGGDSLWTCEKQADLETDGAHINFKTLGGDTLRYGYAVHDGVLSLLDPEAWTELSRYVSADHITRATKAASNS